MIAESDKYNRRSKTKEFKAAQKARVLLPPDYRFPFDFRANKFRTADPVSPACCSSGNGILWPDSSAFKYGYHAHRCGDCAECTAENILQAIGHFYTCPGRDFGKDRTADASAVFVKAFPVSADGRFILALDGSHRSVLKSLKRSYQRKAKELQGGFLCFCGYSRDVNLLIQAILSDLPSDEIAKRFEASSERPWVGLFSDFQVYDSGKSDAPTQLDAHGVEIPLNKAQALRLLHVLYHLQIQRLRTAPCYEPSQWETGYQNEEQDEDDRNPFQTEPATEPKDPRRRAAVTFSGSWRNSQSKLKPVTPVDSISIKGLSNSASTKRTLAEVSKLASERPRLKDLNEQIGRAEIPQAGKAEVCGLLVKVELHEKAKMLQEIWSKAVDEGCADKALRSNLDRTERYLQQMGPGFEECEGRLRYWLGSPPG